MLLKLSLRNILRNRRRTFLTGLVIGIGLAALMFTDSLVIGTRENMTHAVTDTFLGNGQIHSAGFRETLDSALTVKKPEKLSALLDNDPQVKAWSPRALAYGMISSPANIAPAVVYGIEPLAERRVSKIAQAVKEGGYLEVSGGGANQILIGRKLAETMEAGIGDKLVATVSHAGTGGLSQELFRVKGIFEFGDREMDGRMVFVNLETAQSLLGINKNFHEIAVRTDETAADNFWKKYSGDGNESLGWKELLPEMSSALDFADFSTLILGVIIFAVVCVGVVNTLFMSIYERMFEFGILRAVGTRSFSMAGIIMLEAGWLSFFSMIIGAVLGWAVIYIVSRTGIRYEGIELAGVTIYSIYPVLQARQFFVFPAYVFILTLLAALYPAFYASRITPVKAMRHE